MDVHMELNLLPCQHESTWAWHPTPLRVDVINGWPLNINIKFKLVKNSNSDAILYAFILWTFNILSKIWVPHIDLKLF